MEHTDWGLWELVCYRQLEIRWFSPTEVCEPTKSKLGLNAPFDPVRSMIGPSMSWLRCWNLHSELAVII